LRAGDAAAAAGTFVEMAGDFASSPSTVAQALNLRDDEAAAALGALPVLVAIPDGRAPEAYTTPAKWDTLRALVLEAAGAAHRAGRWRACVRGWRGTYRRRCSAGASSGWRPTARSCATTASCACRATG